MKEVWKFPILPEIEFIEMPIGAEILTTQLQGGRPFVWALVEPLKTKEFRKFKVLGTGHSILETGNDKLKYINTFQINSELVFHLFEITKNEN